MNKAAVIREAKALVYCAYHEAGHSVCCRVLDFPAGEVSIVGDEQTAGYSISASADYCQEVWRRKGWRTRFGLRPQDARAVIAMAGACSELHFFNRCSEGINGPNSDGENVYLATDGDEDLQRALWRHCGLLVQQYAPVIDCVARVLLVKQRLSAQVLDQLVATLRQGTFL
jgi:hypothetical protein